MNYTEHSKVIETVTTVSETYNGYPGTHIRRRGSLKFKHLNTMVHTIQGQNLVI